MPIWVSDFFLLHVLSHHRLHDVAKLSQGSALAWARRFYVESGCHPESVNFQLISFKESFFTIFLKDLAPAIVMDLDPIFVFLFFLCSGHVCAEKPSSARVILCFTLAPHRWETFELAGFEVMLGSLYILIFKMVC